MRRVPRGRVTTIVELRRAVAAAHGAEVGCPMTTGIFAWIAAHAAEEDAAEGRREATPWWRTLKAGGELNPKYLGGGRPNRRGGCAPRAIASCSAASAGSWPNSSPASMRRGCGRGSRNEKTGGGVPVAA